MKSKFVTVAAALIGVGLGLHVVARVILRTPAACESPCRWRENDGYSRCQPLSLGVEVRATRNPRGGAALWYRADVKNISCDALHLHAEISSAEIGRDSSDGGVRIQLFDSQGSRVPFRASPKHAENADDFTREVHPYVPDSGALESQRRRGLFEGGSFSDLILHPEDSISTVGDVLAPYRDSISDMVAGEHIRTLILSRPIDSAEVRARFATPPPGFRALNGFDAMQNGRYTAVLLFDGPLRVVQIRRIDSFPSWTRRWLSWLAWGLDWELSITETVHLRSPAVPFEVGR